MIQNTKADDQMQQQYFTEIMRAKRKIAVLNFCQKQCRIQKSDTFYSVDNEISDS